MFAVFIQLSHFLGFFSSLFSCAKTECLKRTEKVFFYVPTIGHICTPISQVCYPWSHPSPLWGTAGNWERMSGGIHEWPSSKCDIRFGNFWRTALEIQIHLTKSSCSPWAGGWVLLDKTTEQLLKEGADLGPLGLEACGLQIWGAQMCVLHVRLLTSISGLGCGFCLLSLMQPPSFGTKAVHSPASLKFQGRYQGQGKCKFLI